VIDVRAAALATERNDRMGEDAGIIRAVLDGDVDAFAVLVRRYSQRVFEVVGRRVPANDLECVAQAAFVSAFRSLGMYEPGQLFEHWLLRIARRRCCDYWRDRRRRHELPEAGLSDDQRQWLERVSAGLRWDEFERECQREEAVEVVHKALAELDPENRVLVECIYFEELPLKEVAATLEWSLSKVKVRAFRARKKLRQIIERLLDIE